MQGQPNVALRMFKVVIGICVGFAAPTPAAKFFNNNIRRFLKSICGVSQNGSMGG
jgi:hypothetical protein